MNRVYIEAGLNLVLASRPGESVGELKTVLAEAFPGIAEPAPVINLR